MMLPDLQNAQWAWLVMVTIGAPSITWESAKNLYSAAVHGFVLTGVPERHVYRDEDRRLFRNNVIGWIVTFPIIAAGAVLLLVDAWAAVI
ncbi:MAG: hypothetical protein ACKOVA_04555 [Novosphingobium sp.]